MKDLIYNLNRKIQDLEKRIQILNLKFSKIIPELGDNQDLLSAVASLQSSVTNINSDIQAIQSNITNLNTNFGGLVDNDRNIQIRVSTLEDKIQRIPDDMITAIDNITIDLQDHETRLSQLDIAQNALQTNLENGMDNLQNQFNTELNKVANNASDSIEANRVLTNIYTDNACNNLSSEINNLASEIDMIDSQIADIQQQLESFSNHSPLAIDNEIYFILQGSYVSPQDLTDLYNGNYTI